MTTPRVSDEELTYDRREQRGWYWYAWADSAFSTTVLTVFLGPYLTAVATTAAGGADGFVSFLGLELRPKAYFTTMVTISVLLQIVIMPIIGALADHTGRKRGLLGVLAYLGAFATIGFYFVSGDRYLLGGVLFLVANVAFGAARVVCDALLPQIAAPDDRAALARRGWGFGYLGGGLLLALNLALYLSGQVDEGLAVRISLSSAGLWWALFTILPMLRLRDRRPDGGYPTAAQAIGGSLRQLGRTIAELRRFPRTLLFLAAYLVYNDGIQTILSFSATYAEHELGLGKSTQISAILMVQFVAFFGALALGWLAARLGTKRTVLASLVIWIAVVSSAYFLQAGAAIQFYVLAFFIALVLGGTQALSRPLYSPVIPRSEERRVGKERK